MLARPKLSCWEIIQCKKKDTCPRCAVANKACWEVVQEDDACSFHICTDCLVYLATKKQPFFSKNKIMAILERRRMHGLTTHGCNTHML